MIVETTEVTREFLGKPINLRVKYIFHEGFTENKTDPAEPASVEITSIATKDFSPRWTAAKQWIEVKASKAEEEDIADEILGV